MIHESINTKKVTVNMALDHKWYIEEMAHKSRITEGEALFRIIASYVDKYPIKRDEQ